MSSVSLMADCKRLRFDHLSLPRSGKASNLRARHPVCCLAPCAQRMLTLSTCKTSRSSRTLRATKTLPKFSCRKRSSSKCAAVGALVHEGWSLWAALSACAAGGQVLQEHTREHTILQSTRDQFARQIVIPVQIRHGLTVTACRC